MLLEANIQWLTYVLRIVCGCTPRNFRPTLKKNSIILKPPYSPPNNVHNHIDNPFLATLYKELSSWFIKSKENLKISNFVSSHLSTNPNLIAHGLVTKTLHSPYPPDPIFCFCTSVNFGELSLVFPITPYTIYLVSRHLPPLPQLPFSPISLFPNALRVLLLSKPRSPNAYRANSPSLNKKNKEDGRLVWRVLIFLLFRNKRII